MIFKREYVIEASQCDFMVDLSLNAITQIQEDMLTSLYDKLGFNGLLVKEKYDAMWLFTKNRIKILKRITWKDEISAEAFISSKSHVKNCVDFVFKNKDGETAIYGRIEVAAINISSKRIIKISSLGLDDTVEIHEPLLDMDFIEMNGECSQKIKTVKVDISNLDFSKHCNNKHYISFVYGTYSSEKMNSYSVSDFEIDYLAQSYENDLLDVYKSTSDEFDYFVISRDSKNVVKVAFSFKKKEEISK